ncbi:BphX family protein [Symbiobacterium thermophilum]|uniref:Uncharacterized protein n=1 Tax=Symbiobacterium thermophilum TaxID=2734 RepID=A0A1Y2T8D1_SYMTR|nr:hypothetical protein [Symbiobacterium thermophilum]MBY6275874.1 hypothetical protein [Symbiobacterium thermophilum]OTA41967.1 MAG: hypothetical protein A6D92_02515 [Symbiobacterium thermophilum]
MRYLSGWMYGVGALYLAMALVFNPLLLSYAIPTMGLDLEPGGQRVLMDGVFFIGAIVAVLGVFLLRGASRPHLNRELVKLVIWVELIAGLVLNLYLALRGYGHPLALVAFALLHGAIALVGRHALVTCRRHLTAVKPLKRAS